MKYREVYNILGDLQSKVFEELKASRKLESNRPDLYRAYNLAGKAMRLLEKGEKKEAYDTLGDVQADAFEELEFGDLEASNRATFYRIYWAAWQAMHLLEEAE